MRTYEEILAGTKALFRAKRFDEALAELEKTSPESLSPQLLVLRGKCIQLANGTPLPLEEAKKSFQAALKLNERCMDAWLELGHYVLCVEDHAEEAAVIFRKASQILSDCNGEIAEGLRLCLEECGEEAEGDGAGRGGAGCNLLGGCGQSGRRSRRRLLAESEGRTGL